jgi:peptidoglycan hydrolase-like protein with peptidoglycan-binding domain
MTTRMTVVVLALAAMPALAAAQDSTRERTPVDSARKNMQAQDTSGTMTHATRGRRSRSGMALSHDQVMQLQTALSNAGCDAGTADGVLGPKTRRAITCARQKNNVSSNAELYRSLNLDFAPSGGEPSRGTHAMPTEIHATHGDSAAVGGANRGRIRPPATDSMRKPMAPRDTTKRDSTRTDTTSH